MKEVYLEGLGITTVTVAPFEINKATKSEALADEWIVTEYTLRVLGSLYLIRIASPLDSWYCRDTRRDVV